MLTCQIGYFCCGTNGRAASDNDPTVIRCAASTRVKKKNKMSAPNERAALEHCSSPLNHCSPVDDG